MRFSSDDTRLTLASLTMFCAGTNLRGIQDVGFTDELSGDPIYGNDSISVGMPAGQHKGEGTLGLLTEVADTMRSNMGPNWGRTPWTISVSLYEPLGAGLVTYNATRVYLRKLDAKFGKPGGSDPVVETFGLVILDPIDWNGNPIAVSNGGASLTGLVISF